MFKSSVFWNITPCSTLQVNRRFGGTFASTFRVEEQAKQETNMENSWRALLVSSLACHLLSGWFFSLLIFRT
jgi:hypothetical protein